MLSMQDINVTALPSVKLSDWRELPYAPGVYFVIAIHKDDPVMDQIVYIGQAKKLVMRFGGHHRMDQFEQLPDANIAWIPCEKGADLSVIEQAAIDHFKPTLNGKDKYPRARTTPDRPERIMVKLTTEEKKTLERLADQQGLTISDLIRQYIRSHNRQAA